MFPIRMSKLACTDDARIQQFLERAQTGFLGLTTDDIPYVVPLNYYWSNGAVYFHGAAEGRKITMIDRNPRACFTVSETYGTIASPIPAHTDTAYMSAIVDGTIVKVTDIAEATEAMQGMLNKYVPGYYDKPLPQSHLEKYVSSMGSKTAVYKLISTSITAKENEAQPAHMFYPGRTISSERE